MKTDVLAFGIHPDDIELGCAGALFGLKKEGKSIGLVDLSEGELGTRGSPETRAREALAAARLLGARFRVNMKFADGFFQKDKASVLALLEVIRDCQPEYVFCNAPVDRHPDHGRASELVREACFYSGLIKIRTRGNQKTHRPKLVFQYIQDRPLKPDLILDISPFFEKKMKAIQCFSSQFYSPGLKGPKTPISGKEFLKVVESKARIHGREIGVEFGEGFVLERTPGIKSIYNIL